MVRLASFVLLFSFVGLLAGCAYWDAVMGFETETVEVVERTLVTDPETGEKRIEEKVVGTEERRIPTKGPSPLEVILGLVLPGAAGIAGSARWIYAEVNKRKIDKSLKAVVAGVTDAVDKGVITTEAKPEIYKLITAASELHANRKFFEQSVARIKADVRGLKGNS